MPTQKIYNTVNAQLTRFEHYEKSSVKTTLEFLNDGTLDLDENIVNLIHSLQEKEYIRKPGMLSVLFRAYMVFLEKFPPEVRKEPLVLKEKYLLYSESLRLFVDIPILKIKIDDYLERETYLTILIKQREGTGRFSDTYNSRMLIMEYGEDIRFCAPWKKWLIWNGTRWEVDDTNRIYQYSINVVESLYAKAMELPTAGDIMALMDHAARSENCSKIEAMVRSAGWAEEIKLQPDDLDRDLFLFNCRNGMIDLTTGRLYEHDRARYVTRLSPVRYDESADCPVWKNFLKEIFKKNRDLINFVQRVLGMALTGDTSCQSLFILYGTGANGKSTLITTIMKIMGNYSVSTPTETFMQKRNDQGSNDIARLKGTRFVSALEAESNAHLAESIVKRLTGNDSVSARFLYGEYFEFTPTFKIFMSTNHKPKIGGMDNAIWRRIKLIPFDVTIPENKQDRKLQEKLENEYPGILKWLVEGCLKWLKNGLEEPAIVRETTTEYRNQMSALESFIEDCCIRDPHKMTQAQPLYNRYKQWCEENNERLLSARGVGLKLAEAGYDKVRLSSGNHWIGLELKV